MVRLSPTVARSLSSPPSSTVTEIVAVPCCSARGVKAMLPVASGLVYVRVGSGIRLGSLLLAVTRSDCVSLAPAEMPVREMTC